MSDRIQENNSEKIPAEKIKDVAYFFQRVREKNEIYKRLLKTKPNFKTDDKDKIKRWRDEFVELFNSP